MKDDSIGNDKGKYMRNQKSNYDLQVDIAKKIFLEYDGETMIRKFQLQADEQWMYIRYLNTPYRIHRETGSIEEYIHNDWCPCRRYTTVMTIYDLLCFHRGEKAPPLRGQWCTAGTFILTGVQGDTFTRKYASLFSGRIAELKAACQRLDGVIQPPMAGADVTCRIQVTPFFPVLLQFWEGDEEFVPRLILLWDRNADQLLHYETTFYLQGDLLERLQENMEGV